MTEIREMLTQMGVISHPDLMHRLGVIHGLCIGAGGRLRSRQVVAMVVEQWQREQIAIDEQLDHKNEYHDSDDWEEL